MYECLGPDHACLLMDHNCLQMELGIEDDGFWIRDGPATMYSKRSYCVPSVLRTLPDRLSTHKHRSRTFASRCWGYQQCYNEGEKPHRVPRSSGTPPAVAGSLGTTGPPSMCGPRSSSAGGTRCPYRAPQDRSCREVHPQPRIKFSFRTGPGQAEPSWGRTALDNQSNLWC